MFKKRRYKPLLVPLNRKSFMAKIVEYVSDNTILVLLLFASAVLNVLLYKIVLELQQALLIERIGIYT